MFLAYPIQETTDDDEYGKLGPYLLSLLFTVCSDVSEVESADLYIIYIIYYYIPYLLLSSLRYITALKCKNTTPVLYCTVVHFFFKYLRLRFFFSPSV